MRIGGSSNPPKLVRSVGEIIPILSIGCFEIQWARVSGLNHLLGFNAPRTFIGSFKFAGR